MSFVWCVCLMLSLVPRSLQLTYECYPNSTLVVTNPDRTLYHYADVTDEFGECRHHFTDDYNILYLDHCRMDKSVKLMFKVHETLITENDFAGPYRIMCRSIPAEGVKIKVQMSLNVQKLDSTTERPKSETISLKEDPITNPTSVNQRPTTRPATHQATRVVSSITGDNSAQTTDVIKGDDLFWIFDVPANYSALPELCIGYQGDTPTGTSSTVLIRNGCSLDHRVISDFTLLDDSQAGSSNMHLSTKFRFPKSQTIVCITRLCQHDYEDNCKIKCSSGRRRRSPRSASRDIIIDVVLTVHVHDDDILTSVLSSAARSETNNFILLVVLLYHSVVWSFKYLKHLCNI